MWCFVRLSPSPVATNIPYILYSPSWSGGIVEIYDFPTEAINVEWKQVGGMGGENGNTPIESNPSHSVQSEGLVYKHTFQFTNIAANYAETAPFVATINGRAYQLELAHIGNSNAGEYVYRGELR